MSTISFPTNLLSFVSFGKTHKLHNAIDHWLAGVTGQAHVALDTITKEERAVYSGHQLPDRLENEEGKRLGRDCWPEDGIHEVKKNEERNAGQLGRSWEADLGHFGLMEVVKTYIVMCFNDKKHNCGEPKELPSTSA